MCRSIKGDWSQNNLSDENLKNISKLRMSIIPLKIQLSHLTKCCLQSIHRTISFNVQN